VKIFKLLPKRNCLTILQLEQHVFYVSMNHLRGLAFKVGKLNLFSYTPNQDRYRWDEMILWVHGTTIPTKT